MWFLKPIYVKVIDSNIASNLLHSLQQFIFIAERIQAAGDEKSSSGRIYDGWNFLRRWRSRKVFISFNS